MERGVMSESTRMKHVRASLFDLLLVGVSLQEVKATPLRFISDLIAEDSWSHLLMDTLAPRGFVKVNRLNKLTGSDQNV